MNFHYLLDNLLIKTRANRGQQGFIEKERKVFFMKYNYRLFQEVDRSVYYRPEAHLPPKTLKDFIFISFNSKIKTFKETEYIPVIV